MTSTSNEQANDKVNNRKGQGISGVGVPRFITNDDLDNIISDVDELEEEFGKKYNKFTDFFPFCII